MNSRTPIDPAGCDAEPVAGLLSVDEALRRVLELVRPPSGSECVALRDAFGRVLSNNVVSPIDVPPYANSAMDGYAVVSTDLPRDGTRDLHLIGKSFAGAPYAGAVHTGECVRIMTGAVLPEGADTVIMQEHADAAGERIRIGAGCHRGDNVRHAGEDLRAGHTVLDAGKRIMPAELGLLASLGIAEVNVYPRPRVAFFSTGDELRGAGEPLGPGQIYDSNRYSLYGMLTRLGVELLDMGVVPDDRQQVRSAFETAGENADAIITSGGVSVGEADYVKETLEALGQVAFWKIAMKPGKPLAYGTVGDALFFGLPGNPVSVMATFYQFVQPALRRMMGETASGAITVRVPCSSPLKKQPGRMEFQRGILAIGADGTLAVHTTGLQGSHVLSSMSRANCFILLPAQCGDVPAGTLVEVQPFEGLV